MAEIPIQEKRGGGSKLPLILGGLLLLLVLGWCLTRSRDDAATTDTAGVTTIPADTVGGTGTAPRSDTALAPGGTRPDTGAAAGTTTGTGTGTGTSTRP